MTKEKLKALVEESQADGRGSEELCLVVVKIAKGLARRYRFSCDLEDYGGDCVLHVLMHLDKIDVDKNVFSYLCQTCKHLYYFTHRKNVKRQQRHKKVWEAKRRQSRRS